MGLLGTAGAATNALSGAAATNSFAAGLSVHWKYPHQIQLVVPGRYPNIEPHYITSLILNPPPIIAVATRHPVMLHSIVSWEQIENVLFTKLHTIQSGIINMTTKLVQLGTRYITYLILFDTHSISWYHFTVVVSNISRSIHATWTVAWGARIENPNILVVYELEVIREGHLTVINNRR
jgi:hypothetical protein